MAVKIDVDTVSSRLRLHVHDTDHIMPSTFKDTANHPIISRSGSVAPHGERPADTNAVRLLSPHEIAIMMVLASEPRCRPGDPADLHCLAERGLVRLDTTSIAEAHASLSTHGRRIVLRLIEPGRTDQSRGEAVTAARRATPVATSTARSHGLSH
ncbi:hypothetical protein ACJ51O_20570 [Burkholderia pyrrocinia]|uniref:hypothetical protein n=1 Tax=Burkholderia pyrrocinia TaxID=60550 RepID=UPI0038B5C594